MRTNFVSVLIEELTKARGDVLQLSSELNSKVEDIGFEKVESLCKRLRADVDFMKKEYDVLNTVVQNAPRNDVLVHIEAKLAANDNILDFVENYLKDTQGLEPVQVPVDANPTIHSIGLRRNIHTIAPEDGAGDAAPGGDMDVDGADGINDIDNIEITMTPVTKPNPGMFSDIHNRPPIIKSMGTASVANNRNNDDYVLPPTPTLNDVGITNTNIGSLYGSKLTFSSNETPVHHSSTSHILQTATSPAQDDDNDSDDDETYHDEITSQMEKIGLSYKDR